METVYCHKFLPTNYLDTISDIVINVQVIFLHKSVY